MRGSRRAAVLGVLATVGALLALPVSPADATPPAGSPADHWTAERMAAATPRELVVDQRGRGYLRRADGSLAPHGHNEGQLYAETVAAPGRPTPQAKPPSGGGGGDTTGPSVTNPTPAGGATVSTTTVTFSATVTDTSGVRSVTIEITPVGGAPQSFAATKGANNVWSATISGFTNGPWSWRAIARDTVKQGGGNATTAGPFAFTVSTTGGGGGGGTVANSEWTAGGQVQTAAGRIFFEMPSNQTQTSWVGYVCSGTVAEDATTGRSVIITAAHCVYDDANKAFARNVLFIPNQAGTTGSGTDRVCTNDPLGCWTPSFGVVDADWASRTFPANVAWDYAYYVVDDTAAHSGNGGGAGQVLDTTAGDMPVQFTAPTTDGHTHALGYSYNQDPNFMYCAQGLGTNGTANWWLSQCGLTGGSSGGPWVQPLTGGDGPIISVNSWGYTNQPGMAGPKLSGSSASCLFTTARGQAFATVVNRGVIPAGC